MTSFSSVMEDEFGEFAPYVAKAQEEIVGDVKTGRERREQQKRSKRWKERAKKLKRERERRASDEEANEEVRELEKRLKTASPETQFLVKAWILENAPAAWEESTAVIDFDRVRQPLDLLDYLRAVESEKMELKTSLERQLRKSSEEQLGAVFQYLKYISPGSFELTESGELIVDEDRMTPGQMTTLLNLLVEPEEAAPVKSTPPVKKARGKKAEKTTTVRKKREVVKPPETEEEFRALLQENKQATARSLIELQNELRRMAGRRPMTDYTPRGEDFSEYQVNVEELAQQLAKAQIPEEDDSDSDTVSSDEEAPLLPIEQRPVEKRPAVEKQPAVEKRAAVEKRPRQEEKRRRPMEEQRALPIVKEPVLVAPAPAPVPAPAPAPFADEKQDRLATEKAIKDFEERKKQEMISAVRKDIGNRDAITEQGWKEIADFEKLQWTKFFKKYYMKDFIATIKNRGTYKDLLAKYPK